jgi:hypothetical protein
MPFDNWWEGLAITGNTHKTFVNILTDYLPADTYLEKRNAE